MNCIRCGQPICATGSIAGQCFKCSDLSVAEWAGMKQELETYKRALELACENLEIYTSPTSDKWKGYYLSQAKAGGEA